SGYFADTANGIEWAVDNGAQVINMSLGAHGYTSIFYMDEALDYAYSNDVTVIASAGNDYSTTQVGYPAIYPTTIAVGATDALDAVADYSNRGIGLDVVAPGSAVVQETQINSSWGYYSYYGTSMAAPHVAATAAMLIANGTATTPDEMYTALTSTTFDLGETGYDSTFGYGLIQAYDALIYSGSPELVPPVAQIFATPTSGEVPLPVDFSSVGSTDSDGTIVSYEWDFGDNGTSTAPNPSHIYNDVGTFTASLTVTDNDGFTDTTTVEVMVSDTPSPATTMHVSENQVNKVDLGKGWAKVEAVVTIVDDAGNPLSDATVTVSFSGAIVETKSGRTDSNGQVTIQTSGQAKNPARTTGCVDSVTHASYPHEPTDDVAACDNSW
ncbi:MAG: PKD domain-containing protein, partial [Candidatus Electrothrix sp. ATG2]|nr:PKD domain-containing protein [Candidatus Electrothrix sp. ATG2]